MLAIGVILIFQNPHSLGILIEWKPSSSSEELNERSQIPTRWGS